MENLEIKIILEEDGDLTLLNHSANLKSIPKTNEYYFDFNTKKIFKVVKVLHEDLHIILFVEKSKIDHQKVYNLIYNR